MSAAYEAAAWSDLVLGMAAAAAALAGLLFVAVSINLEHILADPRIPYYAAQAVTMLVTPVLLALAVGVPGQSATALGAELVSLAVALGGALAAVTRPATRARNQPLGAWLAVSVLPAAATSLGLLLAGLGTLTSSLGGLYWLPPAIATAFLGGMGNSWTLLIEIRRPD